MTIWSFYGNWKYFMAIVVILYIFLALVLWTKRNLATLTTTTKHFGILLLDIQGLGPETSIIGIQVSVLQGRTCQGNKSENI
jgi:hypothetical protein